ncbi:hypothetical protein I4U23_022321 [Adineta vaga]|nr:hypothetical protein I4U23_022321 [Adineta vaga]
MVDGIPVDSLFIGCYPVEAVLRSSLECLYKKTCIDLISSNFQQNSPSFTVEVLQSETKYGINETVQHMIDRLFVNDWNNVLIHL